MKQHSEGVARMMKSFVLSGEYVDVYTYCGLLHDVGKYSKGFQKYIRAEGEKNLMQNVELIWQEWIS